MDQRILVVLSIVSARNFPRRNDQHLLIGASLNGEVLSSDPAPHSSGTVPINTELAWEMNRKAFQQHKLQRTPIKLLVYAQDKNTHARQKIGYVMLDLRSAHQSSKPNPSWYGVLNSAYPRLKPQLQVDVSLEDDHTSPQPEKTSPVSKQSNSMLPDPSPSLSLALSLDPSGDFYTLGPPSPHHNMYTLSVTLQEPEGLPSLAPGEQAYFYYNLLGNDITSELFTPPAFSPECASIRINSSRELLTVLFASQKEVEVHLCCGSASVCKGGLSLSGLADSDSLNTTAALGTGGSVGVSVRLVKETTPQTTPPAPLASKDIFTAPSVKRNLTRSFEDASLRSPATTNSSHSEEPSPMRRETSIQDSNPQAPPTTILTTPTNGQKTQLPVSSPSHQPTVTSDPTPDPLFVTKPVVLQSSVTSIAPVNEGRAAQPPVRSEVAHLVKFSIDLRSVHNLNMEPQHKCYLRYCYPFFGSPYPVLIQPPVLPLLETDQSFSHSFCSFEFAVNPSSLEEHITRHPLPVEVWQSHDKSPDLIVGLVQVPLGNVLSHEKTSLGGGSTRQVSSLRLPITPSLPSQPDTAVLGYLNTVLILDNLGPLDTTTHQAQIPQQEQSTKQVQDTLTQDALPGTQQAQSTAIGKPEASVVAGSERGPSQAAVVGSLEYNTAMELELWKLAEQEAFEEKLKSRESTHMSKLSEELQKRELQRQTILKQKLDHYSSLERQLQDGLQQLATQQRALVERESKVKQEALRLSREAQSLQDQAQKAQAGFKSQYEQHLEIERMKSKELQSLVNSLKKQVRELESKVQSREAEFESYRQQVVTRPESKLHAELSILQLEKAELERKLSALAKSKQHYREQCTKALSELASCRQREQAAARERLLTQQRELEAMRMQYVENENKNSLRQQITQVKTEVEKLQKQTLSKPQPSTPPHPHSPLPLPHSPPPTQPKENVDPNVARWIEERDILLQTGVYSDNDSTIQKLDAKIRQALQAVN